MRVFIYAFHYWLGPSIHIFTVMPPVNETWLLGLHYRGHRVESASYFSPRQIYACRKPLWLLDFSRACSFATDKSLWPPKFRLGISFRFSAAIACSTIHAGVLRHYGRPMPARHRRARRLSEAAESLSRPGVGRRLAASLHFISLLGIHCTFIYSGRLCSQASAPAGRRFSSRRLVSELRQEIGPSPYARFRLRRMSRWLVGRRDEVGFGRRARPGRLPLPRRGRRHRLTGDIVAARRSYYIEYRDAHELRAGSRVSRNTIWRGCLSCVIWPPHCRFHHLS